MTRKPNSKPDNPEQTKRFLETAKKANVENPDAILDAALEKIIASRKLSSKR